VAVISLIPRETGFLSGISINQPIFIETTRFLGAGVPRETGFLSGISVNQPTFIETTRFLGAGGRGEGSRQKGTAWI